MPARLRFALTVPLLVIAGCAGGRNAARTAADAFFTLPMAAGETAPPKVAFRRGVPGEGEVQGYLVELAVTRPEDGHRLQAPRITVYAGQRASITAGSRVSFVQEFKVESEGSAVVAAPVIGVAHTGLTVELEAGPTQDPDRVALLFSILESELREPLREQEVLVGAGVPATIQLPAIVFSRISGSTVVAADVETFLAQVPGPGGSRDVAVRAVPVSLPRTIEHEGEEIDLRAPDRPPAEDGTTGRWRRLRQALETALQGAPADVGGGWLRISLVRLEPGRRVERPTHLERAEAKRRLAALRPEILRTFVLPADSVSGTKAQLLLQRSYVKDYDVEDGNQTPIHGPIVGSFRVGFAGSLAREDGGSVLRYSWSALKGMQSLATGTGAGRITVGAPEIIEREGVIRLRSRVNLAPVARLRDGGSIAVLVERVAEA
ncbi:MAG: hypothetical protein ACE5JG_02725 [Planctomycetota bacterium]